MAEGVLMFARLHVHRARWGIALSRQRLIAANLHARAEGDTSLLAYDLEALDAVHLESAIRTLRECAGNRPVELFIALMPDLQDTRSIDLPAMRKIEVQTILARDVLRYFPGATVPQAISVSRIRNHDKQLSWLACAVSDGLLDEIVAAAAKADCVVHSIAPAEIVLAAGSRLAETHIVANFADIASEIRARAQRITAVRRCHRQLVDPEAWRTAALVLIDAPPHDPESCEGYVARHAAAGRWLRFHSAAMATRANLRSHRRSRRLFAAAFVLFLLAGGLRIAAIHRDLESVRQQRQALRRELPAALAEQRKENGKVRLTGQALALQAQGTRWTPLLASLAESLPHDAHVVNLQATEDSVLLRGHAAQALRIPLALERSALIS